MLQLFWNSINGIEEKKQRAAWHYDQVKLKNSSDVRVETQSSFSRVSRIEMPSRRIVIAAGKWVFELWQIQLQCDWQHIVTLVVVDFSTEVSRQRRRYMWRQTQKSQAHFGDPSRPASLFTMLCVTVCCATMLHQLLFLSYSLFFYNSIAYSSSILLYSRIPGGRAVALLKWREARDCTLSLVNIDTHNSAAYKRISVVIDIYSQQHHGTGQPVG